MPFVGCRVRNRNDHALRKFANPLFEDSSESDVLPTQGPKRHVMNQEVQRQDWTVVNCEHFESETMVDRSNPVSIPHQVGLSVCPVAVENQRIGCVQIFKWIMVLGASQ